MGKIKYKVKERHVQDKKNIKEFNRKYGKPSPVHAKDDESVIYSASCRVSFKSENAWLVHNALILGVKEDITEYIIMPNLFHGNASYVIADPDGGIFRKAGGRLTDMGYKVLNVADAAIIDEAAEMISRARSAKTAVFISAPAGRGQILDRIRRLCRARKEDPPERRFHVIFITDASDFTGRPEAFQEALLYGDRLCQEWLIYSNSIKPLHEAYGEETYIPIGACGIKVYLGQGDDDTVSFIQRACGKNLEIEWEKKKEDRLDDGTKCEYWESARAGEYILAKEEIRGLPADKCIVTFRDEFPFLDFKYRGY